jgi:RNA polymerase sigma-70 factor (ECF subfamily)
VARNAAFNHIKHKLVQETYLNDCNQEVETDTPEEIAFAKDMELLVEMALGHVPKKRSEVYRLSRSNGLANDEIAGLLGISRKTVENNLTLALKAIRKIIGFIAILF